ncbi:RbsD/FucU domain-containing protein [Photobacterium sp. 1_MG-2023]|uniref:RbsD/FucU domain-containing protein n=1 Tax=Photobacterium sp. 1_MG-2023 TaxID=3062646 RepID=UPI0034C5D8CE
MVLESEWATAFLPDIVRVNAGQQPSSLERFDFYNRAQTAFVIIQCAEFRPYGSLILRKGVINQ